MKTLITSLCTVFCLAFMACSPTSTPPEGFDAMIDTWVAVSSSGGLSGSGYDVESLELSIDDNHDFVLEKGGQQIASGSIELISETDMEIIVEFTGTKENQSDWVDLVDDGYKYLSYEDDKMHLVGPCCDRFNILLEPK